MNHWILAACIAALSISSVHAQQATESPSRARESTVIRSRSASPALERAAVRQDASVAQIRPPAVNTQPCAAPVVGSESYGFDPDRDAPYVQVKLSDGSVQRTYRNGVEIIAPNGSKQWIPAQYAMMNAQEATPPALPADPQQGRLWLERHSDALKNIITGYLHNDQGSLQLYEAREKQKAGNDLFKLITYRTEVASFYAANKQ